MPISPTRRALKQMGFKPFVYNGISGKCSPVDEDNSNIISIEDAATKEYHQYWYIYDGNTQPHDISTFLADFKSNISYYKQEYNDE